MPKTDLREILKIYGDAEVTVSDESAKVAPATLGSAVTISQAVDGDAGDADHIAGAINSAGLTNVSASVDSSNRVVISHSKGGDIRIKDTSGHLAQIGFTTAGYFLENPESIASASPSLTIIAA